MLLLLGVASSLLSPAVSQVGVNLTGVPLCAQSCLANNTGSDDGCAITDVKCLCSSINYINALSCCLEETCSSADQKTALAFDIELCSSYNVSIPNFLGCSPLSSSVSISIGSSTTRLSQASANSSIFESIQMSSMTSAMVSTVAALETAVTTASGGPVANFTGGKLLQGSCTSPVFNVYAMPTGGILEYPWVGCSDEQPGCCPFNVMEEGPLSACPMDYSTISSACCPSGWSVYSSAIAGQTPCYTTPAVPLVPPPATSTISGVHVSIISNQLFTLRYQLATHTSGTRTGIKAGAGVGAAAGGIFLIALLLCIFRSRRLHPRRDEEPVIVGDEDTGPEKSNQPFFRNSEPVRTFELPSPAQSPQARSERTVWSPGASVPSPRVEPIPMELPGDTFINEHHPAYLAADGMLEMYASEERPAPHSPDAVGNVATRS